MRMAGRPPAAFGWCPDLTRAAEHVTPQMLMQRCDTPLLQAATRCAIVLAEVHGWSAATTTGVFYGLKAVLDGHTREDPVPLSEVRQRVRPRSHSSATRIAEVLAELELVARRHHRGDPDLDRPPHQRTARRVPPRRPCLAGGAARW